MAARVVIVHPSCQRVYELQNGKAAFTIYDQHRHVRVTDPTDVGTRG
jgi:hypothetical protein